MPKIAEHDLSTAGTAIRETYDNCDIPTWMMHWSNFSREMPLAHQLLLGPPAIVDLNPEQGDVEFTTMTKGLNISEVTALAEHEAIIPNVFARNVEAWEREPHASEYTTMLSLKHCVANGEITDAYLNARSVARDGTDYREFVSKQRNILEASLRRLPEDRLRNIAAKLKIGREDKPDSPEALIQGLARIYSNNFGYLKILGRDYVYEAVRKLLESGVEKSVIEAFGVIRACKHVFASPLTSALGGYFVCPQFVLSFRDMFMPQSESDRLAERIEKLLHQKQLLEFLYKRISQIQINESRALSESKPPLAVLVQKDFKHRTQLIWEMHQAIARDFAERGIMHEPKLNELEKIYDDRRKIVAGVRSTVHSTTKILEKPISVASGVLRTLESMGLVHWHMLGMELELSEGVALEGERLAHVAGLIAEHWPGDRSLFCRRAVEYVGLARN